MLTVPRKPTNHFAAKHSVRKVPTVSKAGLKSLLEGSEIVYLVANFPDSNDRVLQTTGVLMPTASAEAIAKTVKQRMSLDATELKALWADVGLAMGSNVVRKGFKSPMWGGILSSPDKIAEWLRIDTHESARKRHSMYLNSNIGGMRVIVLDMNDPSKSTYLHFKQDDGEWVKHDKHVCAQ